ncbi:MAG: adenylosuccinate synthetase [Patescibacteria group bacterium]
MKTKSNSYGFCGGAFGDEGKGRIVDEYVSKLAKKGPVVVYRDNGGANAGHTVSFASGKIALHQLPSGIFCKNATVVLGKEMVIHPGDFMVEINQVITFSKEAELATILLDEMAILSLDTHRAFENILKTWEDGGKGSTGRGISPAYADVLLRHPLRVRDLTPFNTTKIEQHYRLYEALLKGLGAKLAEVKVAQLGSADLIPVGTLAQFIDRLQKQSKMLSIYAKNVSAFLEATWNDPKCSYVFEKAQAIGLDYRWGVYPDVTASTTTFDGIFSATEGIIDPTQMKVRAAVIKATYMSSVGMRKLPSMMPEKLAHRIREDANEYGATTRRPRDIAYLDLEAVKYYAKVGNVNTHVLTHMDIVYPEVPIKVCVGYTLKGKKVSYRPDQEFLSKVKPVYKEFKPWNQQKIQLAKNAKEIPTAAKTFLKFIEKEIGTKIIMITTGAKRNQSIKW